MNQPMDAKRILDAYLAPDGGRLADRVLESAFAEIARTPQRQGLRLRWAYPMTQQLGRLATVALVAVVALGGALYVLDIPVGIGGDPSASPSDESSPPSDPPSSPTPVPGPDLASFTSPRFGYTVGVPTEYTIIPATTDWPAEDILRPDVTYIDVFARPDVQLAGMSAQLIPDGLTAAEWMAAYAQRVEGSGRECAGQAIGWEDYDVGGVPGRAQGISCELDTAVEAVWVVDGIGYAFIGPTTLFARIHETFQPTTNAAPTATPPPTPEPTPTSEPTPTPPVAQDIVSWTSYESSVYGYGAAYPSAWTVDHYATREWDAGIDGLDANSPAVDTFGNAAGTVTVSRWRAPHDPEDDPGVEARMLAWIEELCQILGDTKCGGIAERAISLCPDSYCNAAFVVPFRDHVLAFYVGTPDDTVNVVAVWLPETDPALARYGGATNLLRAFVERV